MRLNFRKILKDSAMRFELRTRTVPDDTDPLDEDFDPHAERNQQRIREEVLTELCELLETTGAVANPSRLLRDLHNREKKAVTAIGEGVAIPHVRTLQAREFVMAFARSREGLPFFAIDGEPVQLFFAMVAPPYEDRLYLKVYRALASSLLDPNCRRVFIEAETPNEIWQALELYYA